MASLQFVLARFYQNVGKVVYKRDEPGGSFHVALFVQKFAQLHQFIVDPPAVA
jgi:hypothetical protein